MQRHSHYRALRGAVSATVLALGIHAAQGAVPDLTLSANNVYQYAWVYANILRIDPELPPSDPEHFESTEYGYYLGYTGASVSNGWDFNATMGVFSDVYAAGFFEGQPLTLGVWSSFSCEMYTEGWCGGNATSSIQGTLGVGSNTEYAPGTLLRLNVTASHQGYSWPESIGFTLRVDDSELPLRYMSDTLGSGSKLVRAGRDYTASLDYYDVDAWNTGNSMAYFTLEPVSLSTPAGTALWVGADGKSFSSADNWFGNAAGVPDAATAVRFDAIAGEAQPTLSQDTVNAAMAISGTTVTFDVNGWRYALRPAGDHDGGVRIEAGRLVVFGVVGGDFEAARAELTRDASMLVYSATMSIAGDLVSASTDLAVRNAWAETGAGRLVIGGDFVNRGVAYVEKLSASSPSDARLEVGGTLTTSGPLFMRWGSLKAAQVRIQQDASVEPAWNVTGTWARLQASGRIEGNVLNVDGTINFPAWGENLVIQGDLAQQAGGLMIWGTDTLSRYGHIEVQGGQVNLGGKLWTRFEGQIPGATLLIFDDPDPSIHFSNIRVDGLAAGKTIKPFLRSGEWGFDVVSIHDAPVYVAANLGSASSLAEALPNFEVRSSSPNGTVALYNDTAGQVIQLADRVSTGDTSISLESPTLTLLATLSVNVSYRFETAGKLDLIFHSDDTGLDTLLRRIESTESQWIYTQISEYWSTGALNIAGQSGEFILRLSNSGDPVLNLASLDISSNVPEPAGLAFLGLATLALKRRRRAA